MFTLGQAIGLWYGEDHRYPVLSSRSNMSEGVAHGRVGNHSIFDPETGLPYLNKTLQTFLQVSLMGFLMITVIDFH